MEKTKLEAKIEEKEEKEHRPAAKDNACSALGKMIAAGPDALPIDPSVKLFISALPLRSDFAETKHVYPIMISLFKTHPKVIGVYVGQVLLVCAQVFGSDETKVAKEVQQQLVALCTALTKSNQKDVEGVLSKFPPQLRENFLKYVSPS